MNKNNVLRNILFVFLTYIHITAFAQANEFNYTTAPSVESSDNKPVGSITGSFMVTSTGAAAYNMSIEVPKGIGGIEPIIGITYDSQSGNGLIGWGCNLSGFSVITRTSTDIYHDGKATGLPHGKEGPFCLDGQRLIRYKNDPNLYHPEFSPSTRVVIHDTTSGASSQDGIWFTVQTQDGMEYEYGHTPDSKQIYNKDNTSKTNAWYINQSKTLSGNCISYSYSRSENYVYPQSISYASNVIRFEYENRPDAIRGSIEGIPVVISQRLKAVKTITKANGKENLFRKYIFNYTCNDGTTTSFSRLMSVRTENGNNSSLRPTTLTWNTPQAFSCKKEVPHFEGDLAYLGTNMSNVSFVTADLNGDGISDIIQKGRTQQTYGNDFNYLRPYYSHIDENGNIDFRIGTVINTGNDVNQTDKHFFKWTEFRTEPIAANVDDDDLNELLVPEFFSTEDGHHFGFYVCNKGDYKLSKGVKYTDQHATDFDDILWTAGDYNNDGITEFVVVEKIADGSSYYGVLMGGFDAPGRPYQAYNKPFRFNLPKEPQHIFSADMNCDGLADVVVFYDQGYSVFYNDGSWLNENLASPYFPNSTNYTTSLFPYKAWQGDFNGDGIPDFLICGGDQTSSSLFFEQGDGNGMLIQKHAYDLDIASSNKEKDKEYFFCQVYDIDGDGKTDAIVHRTKVVQDTISLDGQELILPENYRIKDSYVYWLRSDGDRFILQAKTKTKREDDRKAQFYTLGDFNGDGQQELAAYSKDCYDDSDTDVQFRIYRNEAFSPSYGKVTKITNGYGSETVIDYSTMVHPDVSLSEKGLLFPKFPVVRLSLPLPVVSAVTSGNGVAGQSMMKYFYGKPLMHVQGRGLLGMTNTRTVDMTTGLVSDYCVNQWNTEAYVPLQTTEKQTIKGLTVSPKSAQTYTRIIEYGISNRYGSFWSVPQRIETTDFDGNKRIEEINNSDYFLAPVYQIVKYGDAVGSAYDETYYDYTFIDGFARPSSIIYRKKGKGKTSDEVYETETTYVYNSRGLVDSTTVYAGTDMAVTTTYTYDEYGNRESETISAKDVPSIHKVWEYDPSHRFVSKYVENGLSTTSYIYDIWGNQETETDDTRSSYPQTTTYEYDSWGNLKSTMSPQGVKNTYISGWGTSQEKCFFKVEQGKSQPWVKTWYDAVGREVKTESVNTLGQPTCQIITYSNKGLVKSKRNENGDVAVTQYYTYDDRDRCIIDSLVDDKGTLNQVTKYEYGKNWKSVSKDGRPVKYVYDDLGNTMSVISPQDTVSYEYYSSGQPSSVTSCGHTVTMEYDITGNKTRLDDPDAGTMVYTYDSFGRILSQTDACKHTQRYVYDDFGRIKNGPAGGASSVTYNYGSSSENKGLLLSEKYGDCQIYYTYDSSGQVKAKQYLIPGIGYRTFEYAYDKYGQLTNKTYPDGTIVKFCYDVYGNHVETTKDGKNIWKLDAQSSKTSEMRWWLGENYYLTGECNATGLTTAKTLERKTPNLVRMHRMTFAYDPSNGNLLNRTGMMSYKECFEYDAQERLTQATASNGNQTFSYSVDGNIMSKTDIGSYTYDDIKPHAVTGVDNELYLIPDNQQEVTYNEMGKATFIKVVNGPSMDIMYGPDGERWKGTYKDGGKEKIILYLDDYEEVIEGEKSQKLCYLDGGVLVHRDFDGRSRLCVIFTDNLGSVTRIYDEDGIELFHASYDAWGRQEIIHNDIDFRRGYTGHEMLPEFGLINMNGRLYDPLVARFLSTDNYVQEPTNSQNFNRYSYCLNNPLKYTDPSGDNWWIPILANICMNAAMSRANGEGLLEGALIGVASSAPSLVFPSASGIITNGLLHACSSIIVNGINNCMEHRDFLDNWYWAAIIGFAEGAYSGYCAAKANGKNYWWGNSVKYNRTQWSFINTDKPDYSIVLMHKEPVEMKNNDCVVATFTEIENEFDGSRTYEDFSNNVEMTSNGVFLSGDEYGKKIEEIFPNSTVTELRGEHYKLFDPAYMNEVVSSGDVITVHFRKPGHADNVRALRVFERAPEKNTLVFRVSNFNANLSQFNYKNGVSTIKRIGR